MRENLPVVQAKACHGISSRLAQSDAVPQTSPVKHHHVPNATDGVEITLQQVPAERLTHSIPELIGVDDEVAARQHFECAYPAGAVTRGHPHVTYRAAQPKPHS